MIIFVKNEKIVGYIPSAELTEERKTEILNTNRFAIWIDDEIIEIPDVAKQYDLYYRNGEIVYEEIVEPEYEPTEQELIQAELLLNQIGIIAKQNEQDEVLAEILLNQMGV